MTWILASTLLLGAVLVTGFAWYERTHPTTRVLALVATLAALAALGRVAFAPLPNVKPTTDIVLIAGLVLGGAPGFMVGAVAALASNLFFGQGPWTPWQMAAWGAAGVAGALLARLWRGRTPGRVPLAIACGLAGLGFGAVMNLHMWITYSGDHSLAKLGAYFATSLPFDLAHAFGNVVFALAFGPALIRALQRFRSRMEVTWVAAPGPAAARRATAAAGGGLAAVALLAAVLATAVGPGAAPARAQSADAAAASASLRYLMRAQNDDGGWGGAPGQSSTQLHTGWTALGLAAAGRNPRDVGRTTAIDFTRRRAGELNDLGELSRTILVLAASGLSPRDVAGRDLVAELLRKRKADGSFAGRVNTTAFAAMALKAAGRSTSSRGLRGAGRWIAGQANPDGGFNFAGRGGPSGIDDTGAALQGLVAAGRKRTRTVTRAVRFLVRRQNADGGFPLVPGGASNAQSTAWAVQGLLAAGRDPAKVRRSRDPLAYLRSLTSSSGEVRYSRTSRQTPVWVTAQAVMALARKPLPLKPVPRARRSIAGTQNAPVPAASATPAASGTAARSKPRAAPSRARDGAAAKTTAAPAAPAAAPATPQQALATPQQALATPQQALATAAVRAIALPADAHRVGYVAGLAAFAVL
jgi:energy-coupling factor transport system substrate-specific component